MCKLVNTYFLVNPCRVGESLTIVDFAVAAMLPYSNRAELPLQGFEEIERWHTALLELPAWRNPYPEEA